MKGFEKWDQHKIGETPWIIKHNSHPHRDYFINKIINSELYSKKLKITSILEIGGGELIEAKAIKDLRPDIRYCVADVSKSFLSNCRKNNICECLEASMDNLPFQEKEFDLIYMSSVLEHTPNLEKTLKEISRISHSYFITMFKWNMSGNNLKEKYWENRKYFSSVFSYFSLKNKLDKMSSDIFVNVIQKDGTILDIDEIKNKKVTGEWRNGDRLNFIGIFK